MLFLSLRPTLFLVQSRSRSGRHVSTRFLDPVLGAMMKLVGWHSRRPSLERGPQHEGVTQGREGNGRKPPPPHTMCHTPHWASAGRVAFYYFVFLKRRKCIRGHFLGIFGIRSGPSHGFSRIRRGIRRHLRVRWQICESKWLFILI